MPMNNVTKQILASGANFVVRVQREGNSLIEIGLASNIASDENFQLQKANVIGQLGPISIDPTDYSCQITIGSFVPAKRVMQSNDAPGGTQALTELLPSRATALDDGAKFELLEFYNKKSGTVIASFSGVVVASKGINADAIGYAKANIQLWALDSNDLNGGGGFSGGGGGDYGTGGVLV